MGVLNVTPDSFFDGGAYLDAEKACLQAERMVLAGADIIDVGAESTRPGAAAVSAEEEWSRLAPVLRALRARWPREPVAEGVPVESVDGAIERPPRSPELQPAELSPPVAPAPARRIARPLISLDTTKAAVAAAALGEGLVDAINDVHGLLGEVALAEVVAQHGVGVVVMHNARLRPIAETADPVAAMLDFFRESLAVAQRVGIRQEAILLDPGIGFGLTPVQSLTLLQGLRQLGALGFPVLLGTSRKSFLGHLLGGCPPAERLPGTLATTALGVAAGVDCFRVHDVAENAAAARVADAVCRGRQCRSRQSERPGG